MSNLHKIWFVHVNGTTEHILYHYFPVTCKSCCQTGTFDISSGHVWHQDPDRCIPSQFNRGEAMNRIIVILSHHYANISLMEVDQVNNFVNNLYWYYISKVIDKADTWIAVYGFLTILTVKMGLITYCIVTVAFLSYLTGLGLIAEIVGTIPRP